MKDLLAIQSNSSPVIVNSIVIENYVSKIMYFLVNISKVQLRHVRFTRNKLVQDFLQMESNSSAIIENRIVTENNVSATMYFLLSRSRI